MLRRLLDFISKKRTAPLFLALGDSIISDCFPGPGRGVAALLQKGLERGGTLYQRVGVTRTGYQLKDLQDQLVSLQASQHCRVGLLSVGGNDLMALDRLPEAGGAWYAQFELAYQKLLGELRQRYPLARWLICNVYDPSEGTGQLPGPQSRGRPPRPEVVVALAHLNQVIARVARAELCDLHTLCRGHGFGQPDCWFQYDIEPTARGAEEIARFLLDRVGS